MGADALSARTQNDTRRFSLDVICALAREARLLPAHGDDASAAWRCRIAGIGGENAARAAGQSIAEGAGALLVFGFAGGLSPGLMPGDLLLPERIFDAAGRGYACDRDLRRVALAALTRLGSIHIGPLIQTDEIIHDPTNKLRLHRSSGAIAVDMESAAVARVACAAARPFFVMRAVLDPASMDLPRVVLTCTDESGRFHLGCAVRALALRPYEAPALLRLGRYSRRAAGALKAAASAVLPHASAQT